MMPSERSRSPDVQTWNDSVAGKSVSSGKFDSTLTGPKDSDVATDRIDEPNHLHTSFHVLGDFGFHFVIEVIRRNDFDCQVRCQGQKTFRDLIKSLSANERRVRPTNAFLILCEASISHSIAERPSAVSFRMLVQTRRPAITNSSRQCALLSLHKFAVADFEAVSVLHEEQFVSRANGLLDGANQIALRQNKTFWVA